MFSKTNKPARTEAAASAPVPALETPRDNRAPSKPAVAGPRIASMLANDLAFEGNISGAGDLHIDSAVKGDVRVSRLTVGETGNIEGSVNADYVEVRGRVVGAIHGKQVKLMSTAYVDGDITHEQLSIDVGAYFQGRCLQTRKGEGAPTHQPAPTPQPVGFGSQAFGSSGYGDNNTLIELKPTA